MEKSKWEYKENFHAIADTGDYSGQYEITNGKDVIMTQLDDEESLSDLCEIADYLNKFDGKVQIQTSAEAENMDLYFKRDGEYMDLEARYSAIKAKYDAILATGCRWVKATEYDKSKGGVLFFRFIGPHLRSIGIGNFSSDVFNGQYDQFPKSEWEYLYILDESTAIESDSASDLQAKADGYEKALKDIAEWPLPSDEMKFIASVLCLKRKAKTALSDSEKGGERNG